MKQIIWDDWQKEILDYDGHIFLAKGRRIGATHLFAVKAVEYMATHYNDHPISQIVCGSITEDQAEIIIAFATQYALAKYPDLVGRGLDRPISKQLTLVVDGNKRQLIARPTSTPDAARGFEGQILMIDEAAFHSKKFFDAATAILATTNGKIWMWSTFDGKDPDNYFWNRYDDIVNKGVKSRFKLWVKDTETVFRERPISVAWTEEQRAGALQFLEEEKKEKSEGVYGQEYLARPLDEIMQFFPDDLIDAVCCLQPETKPRYYVNKIYGGFDIARYGEDESTYEFLEKEKETSLKQIHHEISHKQGVDKTADRIAQLDTIYKSKKLGIDTQGVGGGVYDILLNVPKVKNKVVSMENGTKPLDPDGNKMVKFFKEEMYINLLTLMQRGHIKLYNLAEIKASLKSVRYEYTKSKTGESELRIYGRYTHIAEGIIRAAWLAVKDKSLKPFVTHTGSRKLF